MRRRGSSLIEFALVTPLLLLLMAGVLDYAVALRTAIAVSDAARAGAQYGSLSPSNWTDFGGMEAAARNSAPKLTDLSATAKQSCKCADGAALSCAGSCASGPMRLYVEVTTQATAPNWFAYPALGYTGAVSSTAVMRVK
jgi:Flp pilus assembly protein TadG